MDTTDLRDEDGREVSRPHQHSRARLVRRVIVLQFKLFADGLRDFVMMPLSLLAALFGLISQRHDPELYLDRLMYFGRETDRWINLFDHEDPDNPHRRAPLDRVAEEIESAILRDYDNGGLSAKGAAQLRELAERLRRRRNGTGET